MHTKSLLTIIGALLILFFIIFISEQYAALNREIEVLKQENASLMDQVWSMSQYLSNEGVDEVE